MSVKRINTINWSWTTFGECSILVRDTALPDNSGSISYIGLEHIEQDTLSLASYGTAEDVSSAKFKFRQGDILFGKLRPYFRKVVRPSFDGICSTDIWVVRASHEVDTGFLYYLMASSEFIDFVTQGAVGTRMPRAKWDYASQFNVLLPPLPEQRAIAHILGTLDDKIELNRRMNQTLEAISRTIFKDWFVDFGPVRAKMEGDDPYLPPELWELFPDTLDGEGRPAGWEVSEIGKEVNVFGGGTPSTKDTSYWNGGTHNWATPKDLSKLTSPVLLDTDRKITDAGLNKISSGLLPAGTVLLSSRAPIGYLAIAEAPTAVNQGFIAMVCNRRLPSIFILFWCYQNIEYIKAVSSGSTFAEVNKRSFRPIPVTVPSNKILTAYYSLVQPLYARIVANTKANKVLSRIRDLLLPKLISGKIRITEAENALQNPRAERRKYQNPDLVGQILKFSEVVVIVGLSTDARKDSHVVAKFLQSKGVRIIPVHPQADLILGEKVYRRVADITERVDIVNVFRPSHECSQYAEQAAQIGAKVLWLQLDIFSEEAAEIAREAGMAVIMNLCIKVEYNRHYASITSSE